MRKRALYTLFGIPTGFHARSARDPLKDLEAEMWGMKNIVEFAYLLNTMVFIPTDKSIIDQLRHIYHCDLLPEECRVAALAFLDDCEKVL